MTTSCLCHRRSHWPHFRGPKTKPFRLARSRRLLLEPLEHRLLLAVVQWDGGPTGAGTDWHDPANWSGDALPEADDDVEIGVDFADVTISSGSDVIIRSLDSAAALSLTGATFSIATTSTASNTLTLANGTLDVGGDLTISGLLTWTGGTLTGSGRTVVQGGMDIRTAGSKWLVGHTLVNTATATWVEGSLYTSNGATFANQAGATFDIQSDDYLWDWGGAAPTFDNAGIIRKSGGAGASTFYDVVLDNSGQVEVHSGTLSLSGGGTSGGDVSVMPDAVLVFAGGNYTLDASSSIGGAGTVQFNGATVDIQGAYDVTGTTEVSNGIARFANDLSIPDLTLSAGTLDVAGEMTVSGLFAWTGGTLTGDGRTSAEGGLEIREASNKSLVGHTLVNAATTTWTEGPLYAHNGATFANQVGATFDIQSNDTFWDWSGAASTLENDGSIRRSGGNGTSTVDLALNNSGLIEVQSGTLNLSGRGASSGDFSVVGDAILAFVGGTHTLDTSSSVSGAGTVQFNGATVEMRGTCDVTGTTEVISGTLSIPATLTLSGTLTLAGGTLDVGGALTVSEDLFTWTGGTLTGSGRTLAQGGLEIRGTADKILDGHTVVNPATATWAEGDLHTYNGATFTNEAGATFDIQSDGILRNWSGAASNVDNAGTVRKSSGTGTSTFAVVLSNSGLIEVQSGTLNLSGGGASSGDFVVGADATLMFSDGAYMLGASSSVTGAGAVGFTGGAVDILGAYGLTGTTEVSGGAAHFANDVSIPGLILSNGTMDVAGEMTVSGPFLWKAGMLRGSGRTLAQGGLEFSDSPWKTLEDHTLINSAMAIWTDGDIRLHNSPTFINDAGATFDIQCDRSMWAHHMEAASFDNGGIVRKTAGDGAADFLMTWFSNLGTVEVRTGQLGLSRGGATGSFFVAEDAALVFDVIETFDLDTTSSLTGAGNVEFRSGTVNVRGDYDILGHTIIDGGTVHFADEFAIPSIAVPNGEIALEQQSLLRLGTLYSMPAGKGAQKLAGDVRVTGGQMIVYDQLTFDGDGTKRLDDHQLVNAGRATWLGGSIHT